MRMRKKMTTKKKKTAMRTARMERLTKKEGYSEMKKWRREKKLKLKMIVVAVAVAVVALTPTDWKAVAR